MTDKFVTAQSMSLIDQKTRVREGYLKKKSPKGFLAKVWQTRYLVLYDDVLQYFKDKRDANPAGVIPLQTVTKVYTQPDKHSGCRFDVVVGDESGANTRIFCFLTDTDRECDDWVRDLNELVKRFSQEEHKGLEIEARGKFWKNTTEIREARARSSASWGDQRYLLSEDEAKTPSSNSVSESDATSSDSIKTSGLRFGGLANDFASPITQTRSLSGSISRKNLEEPPIEAVKLLTEGSQGQIMLVRESATGTQFLMHAYRKNNALFSQYKQLMIDMADIVHPYIFQQVHTGECADAIFAVYTYPIDQSLFVHLRQHRRFPEHVARLFTAEVVLALGYLHKLNRLFLKLEPENIFLDEDGHACISDFLLCMPREHLPKEIHTPEYDTPEHLRGEKESSASDWWRLGVLLYELTVGFPPFRSKTHDAEELAQKIRSHKVEDLRFPPFLSPDAQDFIKQLLTVDISGRLGGSALDAEDVKKHPFFKDINWPQLECRQVSSPDWVDEMLQNERRSARDAALEAAALSGISPPGPKLATVTVHVIEARGLPGLKPNGVTSDPYVKVMCDKQSYKTKAITDTVKPRWDEKFNVEVVNPAAEIELRVYHNDDSVVKHARIGMVTLPVSEIRTVKFINAWYSIIGQDCIAHGEVHLSLAWADKPIVKTLDPPTKASRAFIDLFPVRSTPSGSIRLDLPPPPPPPAAI